MPLDIHPAGVHRQPNDLVLCGHEAPRVFDRVPAYGVRVFEHPRCVLEAPLLRFFDLEDELAR